MKKKTIAQDSDSDEDFKAKKPAPPVKKPPPPKPIEKKKPELPKMPDRSSQRKESVVDPKIAAL